MLAPSQPLASGRVGLQLPHSASLSLSQLVPFSYCLVQWPAALAQHHLGTAGNTPGSRGPLSPGPLAPFPPRPCGHLHSAARRGKEKNPSPAPGLVCSALGWLLAFFFPQPKSSAAAGPGSPHQRWVQDGEGQLGWWSARQQGAKGYINGGERGRCMCVCVWWWGVKLPL